MSWLCALPLAASLFSACAPAGPLAVGYVEGEYVLLAPLELSQVEAVEVVRGDRVGPGQTVARMRGDDARIAVAQAEAALAQSRAQLADLGQGRRPEEIAVLEAALRAAGAEVAERQRVLERVRDLFRRGIATQAQLDEAATALEMSEARKGQAEANLAVGRLPARPEAIRAAEQQVAQAVAALESARWRLSERTVTAPAAGRIDDVIRRQGDIAGPAAPILSLLPDGAVKLKVYVPEPAFASVAVGTLLSVRCDGCPPGLTARVSYVSPEPEFTPPVIYSLETRQKLVHLVEARPEEGAAMLRPGQIVDVELKM